MAFRICILALLTFWILFAVQIVEAKETPILTFRSKIELKDVGDVRRYIKQYFEKSGIQIYENYGPSMDLVTRGFTAFTTYGYVESKLAYIVSNVGVGELLRIYVFDDGQTPLSLIEEQAQKLTAALASEYNLDFYQIQ